MSETCGDVWDESENGGTGPFVCIGPADHPELEHHDGVSEYWWNEDEDAYVVVVVTRKHEPRIERFRGRNAADRAHARAAVLESQTHVKIRCAVIGLP